MNLVSVGIVLKITFHVSHRNQLKFKGHLVHHQNKLLYLKIVVSPSVEPVTGRIANPKVDLNVCNVSLLFIKNVKKNPNADTFVCNFCNTDMFPFAEIDLRDFIDLSFNSDYVCSCLENNKLKNSSEDFMNKIINLKELKFDKNQNYSNKDPNNRVIDPTNFNCYLTHDFHTLHIKNSKKTNYTSFSVLQTNICSLHGNFDNLEQLLNNLELYRTFIDLELFF